MNNSFVNPLDGLSDENRTILASLTPQALELEAKTLDLQSRLLKHKALGLELGPNYDQESAELHAGTKAFLEQVDRNPHLAKPLADIGELAKRARDNDPAALERLSTVLAELKAPAREAGPHPVADVPRENLQSQAPHRPPTNLANEIEGEGLAAALSSRYDPKAVPEDVATRYQQRGKEFIHSDKVAFVDHGSKLQSNKSFDGYAIQSMVSIAEARGWDSIKVTGDEAFRRAVWYEATTRGIAVKGYEPTENERLSAASAAERNGRLNRIEENLAAKAFTGARDPEARKNAATAHPELKAAFALEAALQKFAQTRLQPQDRDAFMERQRQNIARDLAQGSALPAVAIRSPRLQSRDRDRYSESER